MNKELYIKNEKQSKELSKLRYLIRDLQEFLRKNEKNFKRKESIDALKRIKEYLELKKKEYTISEKIHKETHKELISACKHEIAIKYYNMPYYKCLTCNHDLSWINEVPKTPLISIDPSNDYEVIYTIEELLKEVMHSDKDLIETISTVLEEIQYEKNIKVYRRSK